MVEDIDSDLVGEFEGTHRESGPEAHRGIDRLDRDVFLLVNPGGPLEIRPEDARRDESGDILLDHHDRLAERLREIDCCLEGRVARRVGADDLDEFAERPAYPFEASVDVLGLEVPHPDVVTVQGRQLRDAMAHLPRPDHREFHWLSRPMMDGTELKVWCKTFMSDPPFIRPWMDSPRRFSSSERLPWRSSFRSSSSRRSSSDADTIHGVLSCAQSRGQRFWPSSWCPPRRAAFSARSGTPRTGSSSWWRCSSRSCTTTTASIRRRSLG